MLVRVEETSEGRGDSHIPYESVRESERERHRFTALAQAHALLP